MGAQGAKGQQPDAWVPESSGQSHHFSLHWSPTAKLPESEVPWAGVVGSRPDPVNMFLPL